ncbi:hypothetical protein ACQEVZ_03395 [Dactylosporangium sp. CA-152071]|uniref:hypothetical protein n=1 Tax=Dactylosporangium sp. CA-152071 TaxID=3239933 RepID=UPI003D91351A
MPIPSRWRLLDRADRRTPGGQRAAALRHVARRRSDRAQPVGRTGAQRPLPLGAGRPGYYARADFTPAGDHGFRKPSLRIPEQGFQVIRLSAHEPWMTGTFVNSSTFWDHDCVGLRE